MKKLRLNAEKLKALAHPLRLAVLDALLHGRKCVNDVKDLLGVTQPNLSQHLSRLKREGIVDCIEEGRRRCYHLTDPDFIMELFRFLDKSRSGRTAAPSSGRPAIPSNGAASADLLLFDSLADRYDRWFDSKRGKSIFSHEAAAIKKLAGKRSKEHRWLEVGVGTGRFAEALGIPEGVDPSQAVLEYAGKRGILTTWAVSEALPFPDSVFDSLFMIVTICFVTEPRRSLAESARVLKQGGFLITGLVPADSPWGEKYARESKDGHPFYSSASFYTCHEVMDMAGEVGLKMDSARSCLFSGPDKNLGEPTTRKGIVRGAGFVAMKFVKR